MTSLICISGSSGVGKTTIATLIQSILGNNKSIYLSGDDLHKWERTNPIWKTKTHLDPTQNNLESGHEDIISLLSGKEIERKQYNHHTGTWDNPLKVKPKEFIIYEGLHALYHVPTLERASLTIFVDTDESLKTEWKIRRDVKIRGYTESQVLETINQRKKDEELFIAPQRQKADVIVKFTKNRDATVFFEYISVNGRGIDLMDKVKNFYDSVSEFMSLCKWLSLDPSLVQGAGGNVSIKSENGLIVKSSGVKMGDVNLHHGFALCGFEEGFPLFVDENEYAEFIKLSAKNNNRPSMETGFHAILPKRVVVHTHPIHLNSILCSKEARTIVKTIFHDFTYDFIEYNRPGMNLANRLRVNPINDIIFLENHGLIVCANNAQEAFETTERINNRCKRWLANHVESFVNIEEPNTVNRPLFPDSAVFLDEMYYINDYIFSMLTTAGLTPNFLNKSEIDALNSMTTEKYRKSLI
jgi:uridine kinase/ribulose-5-phosphate 4-epimerase/fuculose-1-phosphate aldolase